MPSSSPTDRAPPRRDIRQSFRDERLWLELKAAYNPNHGDFFLWPQLAYKLTPSLIGILEGRVIGGTRRSRSGSTATTTACASACAGCSERPLAPRGHSGSGAGVPRRPAPGRTVAAAGSDFCEKRPREFRTPANRETSDGGRRAAPPAGASSRSTAAGRHLEELLMVSGGLVPDRVDQVRIACDRRALEQRRVDDVELAIFHREGDGEGLLLVGGFGGDAAFRQQPLYFDDADSKPLAAADVPRARARSARARSRACARDHARRAPWTTKGGELGVAGEPPRQDLVDRGRRMFEPDAALEQRQGFGRHVPSGGASHAPPGTRVASETNMEAHAPYGRGEPLGQSAHAGRRETRSGHYHRHRVTGLSHLIDAFASGRRSYWSATTVSTSSIPSC